VRGAVVVDVSVHFNDPTESSATAGTALGYWQNVLLTAPMDGGLSNAASGLAGLCAERAPFPVEETYPKLAGNASLFREGTSRYQQAVAQCGISAPLPAQCAPPGVGSCCPALDGYVDAAKARCELAKCNDVAFARCLYDCCASGAAECAASYATVCAPPPSPKSSPPPPSPPPPSPPPDTLPAARRQLAEATAADEDAPRRASGAPNDARALATGKALRFGMMMLVGAAGCIALGRRLFDHLLRAELAPEDVRLVGKLRGMRAKQPKQTKEAATSFSDAA
jgi:hypothetical protein